MATTAKVQTAAQQLEGLRKKRTRLTAAIEKGRTELSRLTGLEMEAGESLARVRIASKLLDDPAAAKQAVEDARDLLRRAVSATTEAKEDLQDTERAALGLDPQIDLLVAQVAGGERARLLAKLQDRAEENAQRVILGLAELGLLLRTRSGGPVNMTGNQLVEGGLGERAHPAVLAKLADELKTLLLREEGADHA